MLLKDCAPLSELSPTTFSGKLFHTSTAEWMKVLLVESVLEVGTNNAWRGIDWLARVALLALKGSGSNALRSVGHVVVCILYRTVTAATWRLCWRGRMFSLELASSLFVPMMRRAFF